VRITSASRNVAEFFDDLFVGGVAPRLRVDVHGNRRIAAEVVEVFERHGGIQSEVLDVVVRVRVRPLVAPALARNSRQRFIHLADVVVAVTATQTLVVERFPVDSS